MLELRNVHKSFTDSGRTIPVLHDVNLAVRDREFLCVVGPSGSGKSTLLRIMAGVEKEFFGEAGPAKGVKVGWLPQEPQLDPELDVRGNVELAVKETRDLLKRFTAKCNLKIVGKVGGVKVRWLATGTWGNPEEVEAATVVDCKVEG